MSEREKYRNREYAQPLDKKTLYRMVLRSCNLQGSYNYERMQSVGWLYAILPGLEKIHTEKEDLSLAMQHHLEFFNTHPFLVTFLMGIVLSMEQKKMDINIIRTTKTTIMSTLGGIGDAIIWYILVPVAASFCANISLKGSVAGPILFLLIFNIFQFSVRFFLMNKSYQWGMKMAERLQERAEEIEKAAKKLGVFVVGALTSYYGGMNLALTLENGESPVVLQTILDNIFPQLIPLGLTLGFYFLKKRKKWTGGKCFGMALFLGMIGAVVGLF